MFGHVKLRLDKGLYRKAEQRAAQLGYATVEEFVSHVLETELSRAAGGAQTDEEKVRERLKGLGYL